MRLRQLGLIGCALTCFSLQAAEEESEMVAIELERIRTDILTRTDNLLLDTFADATDPYLEGYIQALIDVHYYEYQVVVVVKNHKVYLANLPSNDLISESIISFVDDLPGVESVEIADLSEAEEEAREAYVEQPRLNGIWFPQSTVLFAPLVADPRQPVNSLAIRWGDRVIGNDVASISLGDDFPIFRWLNVFRCEGDLQIGIEAGIWSVFNYSGSFEKGQGWCELINTDYLVGIPLTYALNSWSFRLRVYHVSSHLGDELLVNHPDFLKHRKNPSMEAIDFFSSYQASSHVRLYFGPGVILHSDPCFDMKTLYVQYGAEFRVLGSKLYYHRLYGTPFFAIHVENWQVRDWDFDVSMKLGYEISKLQGVGRKMRVYVEYHDGFSYEGQFFKKRTHYGGIGLSWGF